MTLSDIVNSEQILVAVGTILGGVWTAVKASDWFARLRGQRSRRAILALEAGVSQTYETYVRAIKDSREDGKLTSDERRAARERAKATAMELARSQGIDLVAELGCGYLDMWISKLVNRQKAVK